MLIEFSVKNYRSFKERVTLDMAATNLKELPENLIPSNRVKKGLIKTAAIYGANASGKSNLIKAMKFMIFFMTGSSISENLFKDIPVESFLFGLETEFSPSEFEIIFLLEETMYRYGFSVDKKKVHEEWLFYYPKGRERFLFQREGNNFDIGRDFKEGVKREEFAKENDLFLTTCASFNGKISNKIASWFYSNFYVLEDIQDTFLLNVFFVSIAREKFKELALAYIEIADLQIRDIVPGISHDELHELFKESTAEKQDGVSLIDKNTIRQINSKAENHKTIHVQYDKDGNEIGSRSLNLRDESDGTKKFMELTYHLIESINRGMKTMIIDELNARLHPLLSKAIIEFYNSENNKNNQLIFTTHDINLLDNELLRRDQIWFTEKDKYGATELYSLADIDKVRNDAAYDKNYLIGKYGAVPFIGNFDRLFPQKEVDNGKKIKREEKAKKTC